MCVLISREEKRARSLGSSEQKRAHGVVHISSRHSGGILRFLPCAVFGKSMFSFVFP